MDENTCVPFDLVGEILDSPVTVIANGNEDIIEDVDFSFDGYQVVRGEFFAHTFEPSLSFNNNKVAVNTACVRRLPDVEYVQILVNSEEKRIAVRPCREEARDSFIWCCRGEKRKPKQVTCKMFFAKIIDLMGWNPSYRYKLLGKLIHSGDEYLFIFDMKAAEVYQRILKEGDSKPRASRIPVFPPDWYDKNSFGVSVEEHRKMLQVNIFNGYTVFSVNEREKQQDQPSPQIIRNTISEGGERHE